jgi:hypothetical protein
VLLDDTEKQPTNEYKEQMSVILNEGERDETFTLKIPKPAPFFSLGPRSNSLVSTKTFKPIEDPKISLYNLSLKAPANDMMTPKSKTSHETFETNFHTASESENILNLI